GDLGTDQRERPERAQFDGAASPSSLAVFPTSAAPAALDRGGQTPVTRPTRPAIIRAVRGDRGGYARHERPPGLLPQTESSLNGNRTTGREPGGDPCESDPDRTRPRPSSATSRPTSTPD